MNRDKWKKKAQSRDCSCINGKDRDNNFNEVIDKLADKYEAKIRKLKKELGFSNIENMQLMMEIDSFNDEEFEFDGSNEKLVKELEKEKYELNKMSSPGFTVTSNHISVIVEILDEGICKDCKLGDNPVQDMSYYDELILKRSSLYTKHKGYITLKKDGQPELDSLNRLILNELLGTSCGAEYCFNMNAGDGDDEYQAQLGEDIDEYNKLVKEGING